MILDWYGAWTSVIHHPLFGIGITLGAYQLVLAAFEKTRWIFAAGAGLHVAGDRCAGGLRADLCRVPQEHRDSQHFARPGDGRAGRPALSQPAADSAVVLADFTTLVIGGVVATGMGVLLGWWFGAEHMILMTMAPKSVTSPIAMLVAEQIGGVAALAAVFVLITGVIRAIFGPSLLTRLGVHSPEARGMALGMTAHAVGTSVALQESEECGAFAALAMSLMGVATAVFLPLAVSIVV